MGNPLLLAWLRRLGDDEEHEPRGRITPEAIALARDEAADPASGLLLFLRRMRYPIIAILLIFSVSVVGLTLIPKTGPDGAAERMSLFDAFYVVSYTATTIGFGETPFEFSVPQRMWVTAVIYMSVLGWAYGIGSLLALTQDRSFRRALARRLVSRKIAHLAEPFHILVGYGNTARRIGRALDDLGRRFVVIDDRETKTTSVDLDDYRADTPALYGDARETRNLVLAGVAHAHCEGVLALTADDKTNLDVTMTTALLRPGLPVIALSSSREMAERMRSFDVWHVVNTLDRFGDHLRILARSPAAYQLMTWLTSAPGTSLPERRPPAPKGRWVVCGASRFADELIHDLDLEGIEVTHVRGGASALAGRARAGSTTGSGAPTGSGPSTGSGRGPEGRSRQAPSTGSGADGELQLHDAGLESAVAFVAAADDDTTNLWLLDAAREINPQLFTIALEQRASNVPLFDALDLDFGMTPAEVASREVMARLTNPGLMAFLPTVPRHSDEWAADLVDRIVERCGARTPELWLVDLDDESTPALVPWLSAGTLTLGDLMRSPVDRDEPLHAVALAIVRDGQSHPAPRPDQVLRPGDRLLLVATRASRRALDATLAQGSTAAYVVDGRFVPSGWLWRRLTSTPR